MSGVDCRPKKKAADLVGCGSFKIPPPLELDPCTWHDVVHVAPEVPKPRPRAADHRLDSGTSRCVILATVPQIDQVVPFTLPHTTSLPPPLPPPLSSGNNQTNPPQNGPLPPLSLPSRPPPPKPLPLHRKRGHHPFPNPAQQAHLPPHRPPR